MKYAILGYDKIVQNIVDNQPPSAFAFQAIPENANVSVGMQWTGVNFVTPEPVENKVTIHIADFYLLFAAQPQLLGNLKTSTNPATQGFIAMIDKFTNLEKGNPLLNGGLDNLVLLGELTEAQAIKLKNFEVL